MYIDYFGCSVKRFRFYVSLRWKEVSLTLFYRRVVISWATKADFAKWAENIKED